MAKTKKEQPDPNRLYRVRNPDTGLYLRARSTNTEYTDKSWDTVGANFPTRDRAERAIGHFVLNTGDRSNPLEIVSFKIAETKSEAVPMIPMDDLRAFITAMGVQTSRRNALWYGLSANTSTKFIYEAMQSNPHIEYFVWLRGKHTFAFTIGGHVSTTYSSYGRPATYMALNSADMVAVRLAVDPSQICQIWDMAGNLIEGSPYDNGA